jgi:hypothetical protein
MSSKIDTASDAIVNRPVNRARKRNIHRTSRIFPPGFSANSRTRGDFSVPTEKRNRNRNAGSPNGLNRGKPGL